MHVTRANRNYIWKIFSISFESNVAAVDFVIVIKIVFFVVKSFRKEKFDMLENC